MKNIRYRCPHCTGRARKIEGADDLIVCEGMKDCQFRGGEDEFEVIEENGINKNDESNV